MVRGAALALTLAALGLGRGPGCGGTGDPEGGPNAPCTRNKDCNGGLVCSEGVCVDLAADAGEASDAGGTPIGDAADDGG